LTAYTERPYNFPVTTIRKDSNTYELIFPETSCEAPPPKLNNYENIESVEISTYPYTNNQSGYTKITVKTIGAPTLKTNTLLYLPGAQTDKNNLLEDTSTSKQGSSYWDTHEKTDTQSSSSNYANNVTTKPVKKAVPKVDETETDSESNSSSNTVTPSKDSNSEAYIPQNYTNTGNPSDYMTAFLCFFVLVLLIGFILMISKDKMAGVVGENNDLDINDNGTKPKNKTKNLRKTINTLDKAYKSTQTATKTHRDDINEQKGAEPQIQEEEMVEIAPQEVVDLDALFQGKNKQTEQNENENEDDDLAEFLNEFTFDEEPEIPEEEPFNEELYQEIINSTNISLSNDDIDKINQLLKIEITSETLENLEEYLKTEAAKPKKLTKSQILENLLTTYSISQKIEFSKEDVDTIKKLMDVELDRDFVTNLATNPNRVREVEKELKQKTSKPHKASEILTLNVKNLLPDLSAELKKHGNKPIVSEFKPNTVYFSEGYDVNKLSVSSELSNISTALKTKEANEYRPSDSIPIVESGYEFSTLSIKDEIPDLEDVKAHPEKYANKKPEKPVVDENALLKSISNVTFKPFYTDVQTEMNQFENFEIISPDSKKLEEPDIITTNIINSDSEKLEEPNVITPNIINPDSEKLEEPNVITPNIINPNSEKLEEPNVITPNIINPDSEKLEEPDIITPKLINFERKRPEKPKNITRNNKVEDEAGKLLKLIEAQQAQSAQKKQSIEEEKAFNLKTSEQKEQKEEEKDIKETKVTKEIKEVKEVKETSQVIFEYENERFFLIKTVPCGKNAECNLTKSDNGYTIFGYTNGKRKVLKHYDSLKTTNMQIRENNKYEDGKNQYIVKIGVQKFIIQLINDNMEFVMDLC
jgi:hypothetical protein